MEQSQQIPPPESYFQGRRLRNQPPVDNLIIFARRTRKDLQQRTFESWPHHRFVLVVVLQTDGAVVINRKQFPLKKNQGLLVFPYQFHQFLDLASDELLWLIITFEFDDPDAYSIFRDRVFLLDDALRDHLAGIVAGYNLEPNSHRNMEILLSTTLFLSEIQKQLEQDLRTSHPSLQRPRGPGQDFLARIDKELLDANWNTFPKIKQLAEKLGYSESRLRSRFKQHFALSLGSYMRNYQIHTAISLMKEPRISLTEIAYESGFSSTAVFCRSFKRHSHCTPRD